MAKKIPAPVKAPPSTERAGSPGTPPIPGTPKPKKPKQ